MEAANVPLVPGYHGANQDPALLQAEADRIGYPVLIKASAGGGGKGMRAVDKSERLCRALASCKREAINSFGDDAVLIEKYVQRPRHIEIQVFGDTTATTSTCSSATARAAPPPEGAGRGPAPGMTGDPAPPDGRGAVAAARAVNYVGAGTVEFIVEQPGGYDAPGADEVLLHGDEHPPAGGAPGDRGHHRPGPGGVATARGQRRTAAAAQDELRIHGHAIEARICAENPDNNFLPPPARCGVSPSRPAPRFERADHGVRVDDGVREGDTISPSTTPWWPSSSCMATREQALARLDAALAQTHIVGLATNVQFLRHHHQCRLCPGRLDTALIQRETDVLFKQEKVGRMATGRHGGRDAGLGSPPGRQDRCQWLDRPWAQRDGWRSHGASNRDFMLEFAGEPHTGPSSRDCTTVAASSDGGRPHRRCTTPVAGGAWMCAMGTCAHSCICTKRRGSPRIYCAGRYKS